MPNSPESRRTTVVTAFRDDGLLWFRANDVARVLGDDRWSDPAMIQFCGLDRDQASVTPLPDGEELWLTESGMYAVALRLSADVDLWVAGLVGRIERDGRATGGDEPPLLARLFDIVRQPHRPSD